MMPYCFPFQLMKILCSLKKNYIYLPFLKFSFTPIMSFAKKLNNDYYFELVADSHVACDKFFILIFYDCVII